MSYCTVSDVRRHSPEIRSDDVSDSDVSNFITASEAIINDALRERYTVPFTTVPDSIRHLCARMTSYRVLRVFPDRTVAEDLERLGDDTRWELDQYRKGNFKLGSSYEVSSPVDGTYFARSSRTETYEDYEVDRA